MQEKASRTLLFTAVIVLIILLVVTVLYKQPADPILSEMVKQQSQTLNELKGLKQDLVSVSPQDGIKGDKPSELAVILLTQQDMQRRITKLETQLETLVKGGLLGAGQKQARQRPPSEDYNKVHKIDVAHSPIQGKKDAPITIVEFADFQCPFCARFHPAINAVLEAYPDKVRYVIKNFPLGFHKEARPAAKAAFAAGEQGKYFEMVDLILKNNRNLSADQYKEYAKQLGLNMKKFNKSLKDNDAKWNEWINEDMKLGASVDVRGTPTFFLNGKKTISRSFEQYKSEIERILKGEKK